MCQTLTLLLAHHLREYLKVLIKDKEIQELAMINITCILDKIGTHKAVLDLNGILHECMHECTFV